MKMQKIIDAAAAILFAVTAVVSFYEINSIPHRFIAVVISVAFCLFFTPLCFLENVEGEAVQEQYPPTELVLLSEENTVLGRWDLYGKTSLLIGKDVGQADVDVNLLGVTYAGMIEEEHAVLNFAGKDWYIEDISAKNGVAVERKLDKQKYRLTAGTPCRLEKGDVIYIASTKLQIG